MSKFFSKKYSQLTPYTPGEQPQNRKYVKLNTNESPYPPSPVALRLAREEAGRSELYSDPECKSLKQAAAQFYGLGEENFTFVNGSDEILNFAFMAYCDDEHPAAFPDISYGFYPVFADLNRIPFETIPLEQDYSIDYKKFCGINKTIFIANPNAPTGCALTADEIKKILETNPDNVVVIDEAYVDFGGESVVGLVNEYKNLLVTQTFSKSRQLAGARLGMGIACTDIIRDLETIRYSTNPYNVNRITMAAGVGALNDKEYFDFTRNKVIETRENTVKELKKLGFVMPESKANFVFAAHPALSGLDIYLKLKEKGILVRHFEKGRLRDYNRITIGSPEQMETLLKALGEILEENR